MSAEVAGGAARTHQYQVPPESIWSSGLSARHVIAPIAGEPSVLELLDDVGVRRYGDEWGRLRRVVGRSLRRVASSSGLAELTRASTSSYVKVGKASLLTVAVEVAGLVYDSEVAPVGAAESVGRRSASAEPMVRYVGNLVFRFSFHSVPGETNLGSVVSSSGSTWYSVLVPRRETVSRRGESEGWFFSRLHPEGMPMTAEELGPRVGSAAEASSPGSSSPGLSSPGLSSAWLAGEGDRVSAGRRSVGAPSRMVLRESADGGSEVRFEEGSSGALTSDAVSDSQLDPASDSVPELVIGSAGELDAPIGDGFWVWGPAGDAGVRRLEGLLRRAGDGASAVVAVLAEGGSPEGGAEGGPEGGAEGGADVEQYHVVHEGGGFRWRAEPSGLPADPPRRAVSGASLIVDAAGAPWNGADAEQPSETPTEAVAGRSAGGPRWVRSDELPHRLLVAEPGAAWHYLVDAEGEILLAGAATGRRDGAGVRPPSPGPERPRVAGELRWQAARGLWEVDDSGGWHVDDEVRAELTADPDVPERWLANVATRLAEHLAVPTAARLIIGVPPRPEPAAEPVRLESVLPEQPSDPAPVEPGLERLGADLGAARLWDEAGQAGVRRLEEALLAAGMGSKAAVVVFRPGREAADRYQVANHDGRIEWTFGLTGAATEAPLDAMMGASVVTGPDGSPLPE